MKREKKILILPDDDDDDDDDGFCLKLFKFNYTIDLR